MTETDLHALQALQAARDAAQAAAAAADLAYGNAVNEHARAEAVRQLNIDLAARNPRKRYEMLQAGTLTPADLTETPHG